MCFIFKSQHSGLPPENIKAYKVYLQHVNALRSPHYGGKRNGAIFAQGVKQTDIPTYCIAPDEQASKSLVVKNAIKLPQGYDEIIDKRIDISGFHCLATHSGAYNYQLYLEKNFTLETGNTYTVMPVTINPKNIFAVGLTPLYTIDDYRYEELETYVVSEYHVSKEDFERALKGLSRA